MKAIRKGVPKGTKQALEKRKIQVTIFTRGKYAGLSNF